MDQPASTIASDDTTVMSTPQMKQQIKATQMDKYLELTSGSNSRPNQTILVEHLNYAVMERESLLKPKERIDILHDVSFYLKPGMMVLLLSGPGAGKTSLFKCLTNRIPKRGLTEGTILFDGHPIDPKTHHTETIYASQADNHIPTLTVKETLDFSIQCQSNLMPAAKVELCETILDMLGMRHVEETIIGNSTLRGISGGQKKRMTVAVELVKGAKTIFMDEPTTGLDSTTSFDLLNSIKMISQTANVPAMVSLLQPSPEIFSLFSHVLMMRDGHVTFFGTKEQNPVEYLASIYELPKLNDHLPLKTTDDFVSAYRESAAYRETMNVISVERSNRKEVVEANCLFRLPLARQVALNLKRALKMTWRDKPELKSRIFKSLILGLLIGCLFFDLDTSQKSTQLLPSLTFFLLTFVVFGSMAGVQQLFIERPIFYDQQYGKYYNTFSYFIAGTCSDLVWIFMDYWQWLHYISPFKWVYESLLVNEVHDRTYTCQPDELMPPANHPLLHQAYPLGFQGHQTCPVTTGEMILISKNIPTDPHTRFDALIVLVVMYGIFSLLSFIGLCYVTFDSISTRPIVARKSKESASDDGAPREMHSVGIRSIKSDDTPVCHLSFSGLTYKVTVEKVTGERVERTLLDNVNGVVAPGALVALMGASGAGKSTLLDILANRKDTGTITGDILLNGRPRDKYYQRYIAYVEQVDVLPAAQTVREAITFSGHLRLPSSTTKEELDTVVDSILDSLELNISHGLSAEQRKRVNIGIELASKPHILFLDEPTSGLDSVSAESIMRLVKKLTLSGCSVICTLHQPSQGIFTLFDSVLLLTQGGYTAYCGPLGYNCSEVLTHCSLSGHPCSDAGKSPADFLLDYSAKIDVQQRLAAHDSPLPATLGSKIRGKIYRAKQARILGDISRDIPELEDALPSQSTAKKDIIDYFRESPEYAENQRLIEAGLPQGFVGVEYYERHASGFFKQTAALAHRSFVTTLRNRGQLIALLVRSILMAIVTGTLYLNIANDQEGVIDRISFIFFTSTFASIACLSNIPSIFEERTLYYREVDSGTYRHLTFGLTLIFTDIPFTLLYSLIFSIPIYWLSGFHHSAINFFFFVTVSYMFMQLLICFSQLLGLACPSLNIANEVSGIAFSIFCLFAGFIIRKQFIPSYFKFLYHISFTKYLVETLTVNEMRDTIQFHCSKTQMIYVPVHVAVNTTVTKSFCPIENGKVFLDSFGLDRKNRDQNVVILLSLLIGTMILILVATRLFKYKK
eukprot:gene7442-8708_t